MKTAVLVLGPPRSGTSVVAHVLNELGVDFGDHDRFVDANTFSHNPIFFELQELNKINDEIFGYFSKFYTDFDWVPTISDFTESVLEKFETIIVNFIKTEFSDDGIIGLKDPRFCFTLPVWDEVLTRAGYNLKYILTTRDAYSVYHSNKIVNRLSAETNFRIVVHSSLLARHWTKEKDQYQIKYEDLLRDPSASVCSLYDAIGLTSQSHSDAIKVIRRKLDHQRAMSNRETHFEYFNNVIESGSILDREYPGYREIFLSANCEYGESLASIRRTKIALLESLEDQASQIKNLDRKAAELQVLNEDLQIVNADLKDVNADLNAVHAEILSSYSWRITKPLRSIKGLINRRFWKQ